MQIPGTGSNLLGILSRFVGLGLVIALLIVSLLYSTTKGELKELKANYASLENDNSRLKLELSKAKEDNKSNVEVTQSISDYCIQSWKSLDKTESGLNLINSTTQTSLKMLNSLSNNPNKSLETEGISAKPIPQKRVSSKVQSNTTGVNTDVSTKTLLSVRVSKDIITIVNNVGP